MTNSPLVKLSSSILDVEQDEQEKINRVEFGVNKFDYKFMAHVMAMLMLPYLMDKNMNSNEFKDWVSMREKKMN